MTKFDVVIQNGRVVLEQEVVKATVCINGSKIAAIDRTQGAIGETDIDATNCFVLPGGIDPHVHVSWPYQDYRTADTYASASVAALHGGTTTILDFAHPRKGMTAPEYLQARRDEAARGAMVDFGLHTVLLPGTTPSELDTLIDQGSTSWKLYLTYSRRGIMSDDGTLARVMEAGSRLGARICIHAENGGVADARERTLVEKGDIDYTAHYRHKPWWVEAEAIQRSLFFAEVFGCRVHVKHLSTRQGVELIRNARRRGVRVTAETCPHYLTLTEGTTLGIDGPLFLCSPPLRGQEDREVLWNSLAATDGVICVGADHCDFTRAQKLENASDFRNIPNGLPGVETRLYILYEEGVRQRGLSMPWLARVFATNAAQLFGLFPRKGSLNPGGDADIVIFDPADSWSIEPASLHMQADWSPYLGRSASGRARVILLRGKTVLEEGKVIVGEGSGEYLPLGA